MTSPISRPKAIVFDLLTALLDSWTIWSACIPASQSHIATGQIWRKRYLELTYSCGAYIPYSQVVHRAAADVGLPPTVADELLRRFSDIEPWPEVFDVLIKLQRQRYKLAVVTNCSDELGRRTVQNLEGRVRSIGAKEFFFDVVVTAQEVGFYKPRPEPYLTVLERLNVKAHEALFVAGSAADIPGASGVGMTVCWNNHIGLERKGDVKPWREGKDLCEALGDIIDP